MEDGGRGSCYNAEEACLDAILAGQIRPGDVVVIRYEGPKGGAGMREHLLPGPHSVGHVARFVLDHAPCDVLLVRT